MKTQKFDVKGMACAGCVSNVEKSVEKLNGVAKVQVSLLTNSMIVEFDETLLSSNIIEQAVAKSGYEAFVLETKHSGKKEESKAGIDYIRKEYENLRKRWWVSFAFLLPLLYLSMEHLFRYPLPAVFTGHENVLTLAFTQLLLTLPIVIVNKKYFTKGFQSLFRASPNMDSLIAIGSSAAIVYGIFAVSRIIFGLKTGNFDLVEQFSHDIYFESGATILTLVTLGKFLEGKSKQKTSDAITKLIDLLPQTAVILKENQEIEIPIEAVHTGDLVVVKAGQQVPVDGIIQSGEASLNESALTGESMPVFKKAGDTVLSASINQSGYFVFQATQVGENTTLAQIIHLVEEASTSKAPISQLADKISRIFVPIIIAIAALSVVIWLLSGASFDFALSIGIAVLVISCPCALGLATPVAIMVGTGKGAEHGILIKSAEVFEIANKVDTVVLDKTGTLTEGKPVVTDIVSFGTISENQLLEISASLEKLSEHPLADAVIQKAIENQLSLYPVENFEGIAGKGIKGKISGTSYWVGNLRFITEQNIPVNTCGFSVEVFADEGKTILYIADTKAIIGIIAIADVLKPTSREAVQQIRNRGIKVIMLTGDSLKTALSIQKQLNLSAVVAEVLPQDKDREIINLQKEGRVVAMVGDGINDAPALMRADMGIAIGKGSDIAIESADVILMKNDLLDVVAALRLSKSVIRIIRQNLFWAFFYNVIGIPLAAGVFYGLLGWKLSPMFAAVAMSLSSISVVLNALRLRNSL